MYTAGWRQSNSFHFSFPLSESIHQFSVFVDLSVLTLSLGTDNTTERTTKSSPHTNSIINKPQKTKTGTLIGKKLVPGNWSSFFCLCNKYSLFLTFPTLNSRHRALTHIINTRHQTVIQEHKGLVKGNVIQT